MRGAPECEGVVDFFEGSLREEAGVRHMLEVARGVREGGKPYELGFDAHWLRVAPDGVQIEESYGAERIWRLSLGEYIACLQELERTLSGQ
jgi:hypothetical protein